LPKRDKQAPAVLDVSVTVGGETTSFQFKETE
jgi:hypothetical protein